MSTILHINVACDLVSFYSTSLHETNFFEFGAFHALFVAHSAYHQSGGTKSQSAHTDHCVVLVYVDNLSRGGLLMQMFRFVERGRVSDGW